MPKNVPSVSQIYYIKVQKQKFWTKLENQKKSSECKKKIYPETINKSLSKFWNHSKTWDFFKTYVPRKFFQTLGTYLEKPAENLLLNFWSIS